ncbi:MULTISPECIES: ABC transporter substrate-binding protein [unclassified Undibacterium]|uniref:substrate-binding periplasmic protein n=1 Tax=unclassified Undibacterium TaxID=2630295 RepID=UPI002AC90FE9|nr:MULTISPECIES: ABC transporter substrate-binding protein [unclassified Undibacterium]MEB0139190.1 ABC transporter substrate-binding protein [Undibacterium sp. CCC2.1]MEB0172235.1 ABC transporter substrate-binding protein [Undibacterium sp. CCC1.1]MEB0175908.1 ABC transporter substrate-binding protein [Undibacterium sp. CCC3.4]MEB0215232.1 ABC transporter substrate-binding protein [Undibacterium sp. 5I2]WPX43530.1 ABC transporter substrate-binding protein [Undibacterium sp. CCC3.4]
MKPYLSGCLLLLSLGLSVGNLHAQTNGAKLAKILHSKELRVCIWPDYYGISFRNPKSKSLSGLDIDISAALAQELGVTLRYVDSSFPQLIDKLLNDECDIAMHAVGVTPARAAKLQFTQAYLRSDMYAVISKNSNAVQNWDDLDKPGRIIAVQNGTVMVAVMQAKIKQAKLLLVSAPMTREQEVESGRADAFMTDYPYSRRVLASTDWARIIAPPRPYNLTDYAYAIAPGDPIFLARLNRFVAEIKKNGRLAAFASKHQLDAIALSQ